MRDGVATRRIELDDPDFLPTDRFEVDTLEEAASDPDAFGEEETAVESDPEEGPESSSPTQAVLDRLTLAGVKARDHRRTTLPLGRPDRRGDHAGAADFDRAMAILRRGDLERAFYAFTELLERRPDSTRLWIFVRAIAQSRDTWA